MTATQKTTRIIRPTSSTLRLDDGEVLHVGVDAHKATYHVALLSDRRGLLATWVQPADLDPDLGAIFDPLGNATHTALQWPLAGEDVLVTGAGPIGVMAAAIVREVDASPDSLVHFG